MIDGQSVGCKTVNEVDESKSEIWLCVRTILVASHGALNILRQ